MDNDLRIAQVKNLILKTRIVIGFFIIVFLIQIVGIFIAQETVLSDAVPLHEILVVPVFIALVIFDEVVILRYLKQVLAGRKKYRSSMYYLLTILEVSYPTMVLIYGGYVIGSYGDDITPFMFLNSPPLFVYFVFIILTPLYFNFRLSVFAGIIAAVEYTVISYFLLDDGFEFWVNATKAAFFIAAGVVAGFVSIRLKGSIRSSLEAKNTLIHELDEKVEERTATIEQQKEELRNHNQLLEVRNEEITASINYAMRIQNAILPSEKTLKSSLPEHFVLYKPKDIVAGDFYWMETYAEASDSDSDWTYIAAADCTGHGVPGAMVSVVCSNALSKALIEEGITDTGKLLDRTRELVIERFGKSDSEINDGMDISLAAIRDDGKQVRWSGANNPLWILRNSHPEALEGDALSGVEGDYDGPTLRKPPSAAKGLPTALQGDPRSELLHEFKADKQPIGKYDHAKPFTQHTIDLQKGDTLYMFSDGFQDQFGGPKGKKFKSANLKKLFVSIRDQSLDNQKSTLDKEFEQWRGDIEQIDDVCIIGVRL